MSYLKSNLVYCFQNSVRLDVQEAIEAFERTHFHFNQKRAAAEAAAKIQQQSQSGD